MAVPPPQRFFVSIWVLRAIAVPALSSFSRAGLGPLRRRPWSGACASRPSAPVSGIWALVRAGPRFAAFCHEWDAPVAWGVRSRTKSPPDVRIDPSRGRQRRTSRSGRETHAAPPRQGPSAASYEGRGDGPPGRGPRALRTPPSRARHLSSTRTVDLWPSELLRRTLRLVHDTPDAWRPTNVQWRGSRQWDTDGLIPLLPPTWSVYTRGLLEKTLIFHLIITDVGP